MRPSSYDRETLLKELLQDASTADAGADPWELWESSDDFKEALRACLLPPATRHARLLPPGTLIGDRYEIIHPPQKGGMGAVYFARDRELGRHVAIKFINLASPTEKDTKLFLREAMAMARLNHPNIITIYDWGVFTRPTPTHLEESAIERPYMIMERVKGRSMGDLLRDGPLPMETGLDLLLQAARALAHAHEHRVHHRDIKPHNIIVRDDGLLKLLDFGLAGIGVDQSSLLSALQRTPNELIGAIGETPWASGTPGYMAPEQFQGEAQGSEVDVWALGVLTFKILTGRMPFKRPEDCLDETIKPSDLPAWCPERLKVLVDGMLQHRIAARLDDMGAIITELESVLDEVRGVKTRQGPPYRFLEPFESNEAPWFFGRESEVVRLASKVQRRALVSVIGPTGSGKSSLLAAGLWARLKSEGHWQFVSVVPGQRPAEALLEKVRGLCAGDDQNQRWEVADFSAKPGLLGQALREHARRQRCHVLLCVDQLEELFTQTQDDEPRRVFADLLCAIADDPHGRVKVVTAMNQSALTRVREHPALETLLLNNVMFLGSPARAELSQALTRPAALCGVEFEEGLADRVLEALVHEPAPLPLLQLTASKLWAARGVDSAVLTHQLYEEIGEASGVIVRHADAQLDALTDVKDVQLAWRLLTLLVTPTQARARVPRKELGARLGDDARFNAVVEHLVGNHLVVAGLHDGVQTLELAHAVLIERWERLSQRLHGAEAPTRLLDELSRVTTRWKRLGQPHDALWRGVVLTEAEQTIATHHLALSEQERAFLRASAAHHRSHQQRRRLFTALTVAVLLLGALALGVALLQTRRAQNRAEEAHAASLQAHHQTRGLIVDMLEYQREALEPVGRLDLLEKLPSTVAEALQDDAWRGDPVLKARALGALARVFAGQGRLNEAQARFQAALTTLDAAPLSSDQTTEQLRRELRRGMAHTLARQGRLKEASSLLNRIIAGLDQTDIELEAGAAHLARARLHLNACRGCTAASTVDKASICQEGADLALARQDLRTSHKLATDALAAPAQADDARMLRARVRLGLGDFAVSGQDWDKARTWFQDALDDALHLSQSPQGRRMLATCHERLATLSLSRLPVNADHSVEVAMKHAREARTLAQGLVEHDEQNPGWRRALAVAWALESRALQAQAELRGDSMNDAQVALLVGQKTLTIALNQAPNTVEWVHDEAALAIQEGRLLEAGGDAATALSRYRQGLTILEGVLQGQTIDDPCTRRTWSSEVDALKAHIHSLLRDRPEPTRVSPPARSRKETPMVDLRALNSSNKPLTGASPNGSGQPPLRLNADKGPTLDIYMFNPSLQPSTEDPSTPMRDP